MSILALAMPVINKDGSTDPDAIYIPGTVVMDNIDRLGGVDWVAFHSPAALAAGDTPIPDSQHHTALNPTLYAGIVSFPIPAGATTYGQATAAALVYLAKNVLDTPGKNTDGTPMLDSVTGQPVLVSFFASATVVTLG